VENRQPPAELPRTFENHLPRRICFGRGQLERLDEFCQGLGCKKVFLVTDQGVSKAGLIDSTLETLRKAGLWGGLYDQVAPEPALEQVDEIGEAIGASHADAVIALGGGSVMDATKVAAILAKHSGTARDYLGIAKVPARGIATIMIPTTSGTGSEATFVAILTDKSTGNKAGVVSPHLLADLAIVDPSLTDRLPPELTASTGMDAMVHALEALIAKVATPMARAMALQSASYLGWALPRAYEDPSDVHARDAMSLGSHLAGIAFANSSCCAVHALALPLGGRYPIAHGVITGTFFGEVMRQNLMVCKKDIEVFCTALGWGELDAMDFCNRLDELAESLGLFDQLRKHRVGSEAIAAMSQDACKNRRLMDPNPMILDERQVADIYRKVLRV
jgi:alcohol dehydrogenase class IV